MPVHIPPLLVVLLAAATAPLLREATSRLGLPLVVFELLLGVAIGPHGLGWASSTAAVPYFALLGLAFLFFLAGMEIDLADIRNELKVAVPAWLLCLSIAGGIALLLRACGVIHAWAVVGIAIATTALGVLVPVVRDAGMLGTSFGRHVLAAGAIGELGPIIAMSLALSTRHTVPLQSAFTLAFLAGTLLLGWLMLQARTPRVLRLLSRTIRQSSQLPIRLSVFLIGALALLADALGLDIALGALVAGMLIGLAVRDVEGQVLHLKMDAVGFGFLVPIFFINSGMKLDVGALFDGLAGPLLATTFVAAILLARLPFVVLATRSLGGREATALGLCSATTLSLIVALVEVATNHGLMTSAEAAPLIGAGVLTVVLFPTLALRLARG